MYGLTPILQNDLFEIEIEISEDNGIFEKQEKMNLFQYYFWLIALCLVIYLVWTIVFKTCIKLLKRCCARAAKFAERDYTFE